jgi:hypothetical protein
VITAVASLLAGAAQSLPNAPASLRRIGETPADADRRIGGAIADEVARIGTTTARPLGRRIG